MRLCHDENQNVLISILRDNQAWCGAGCISRYSGGALDRSDLAEVNSLQSITIRICMIDVCALDLFIVAALSPVPLVARFALFTCRMIRGKSGENQGKPGMGRIHNSSRIKVLGLAPNRSLPTLLGY